MFVLFTFCLDAKSNKKIKANTKLRRFAVPTHRVTPEDLLYLLLFQTTTYAEMLSPLAFFAIV